MFSRTCCLNASGLLILSGAPQVEVDVFLNEIFPQQAEPFTVLVFEKVLVPRDMPERSRQVSLVVKHLR